MPFAEPTINEILTLSVWDYDAGKPNELVSSVAFDIRSIKNKEVLLIFWLFYKSLCKAQRILLVEPLRRSPRSFQDKIREINGYFRESRELLERTHSFINRKLYARFASAIRTEENRENSHERAQTDFNGKYSLAIDR